MTIIDTFDGASVVAVYARLDQLGAALPAQIEYRQHCADDLRTKGRDAEALTILADELPAMRAAQKRANALRGGIKRAVALRIVAARTEAGLVRNSDPERAAELSREVIPTIEAAAAQLGMRPDDLDAARRHHNSLMSCEAVVPTMAEVLAKCDLSMPRPGARTSLLSIRLPGMEARP